jgi:Ca2+:H+ antiporter
MLDSDINLPNLSRVAAVTLLILYVCYWWYFCGTHSEDAFNAKSALVTSAGVAAAVAAPKQVHMNISSLLAEKYRLRARRRPAKLHPICAVIFGLLATALTIWLTTVVLDSMHAMTDSGRLSASFAELVILPTATTTVESIIAVLHACRQEMDWTIQSTIQSSLGIVLFVMPFTICIGWAMGADMTLHFEGFQVVLMFLTVLVVTNVFQGPAGRW